MASCESLQTQGKEKILKSKLHFIHPTLQSTFTVSVNVFGKGHDRLPSLMGFLSYIL